MSDTLSAEEAAEPKKGLVKARRSIQAARERGLAESDGGSTGKSDGND
jgi:hypothetical protein